MLLASVMIESLEPFSDGISVWWTYWCTWCTSQPLISGASVWSTEWCGWCAWCTSSPLISLASVWCGWCAWCMSSPLISLASVWCTEWCGWCAWCTSWPLISGASVWCTNGLLMEYMVCKCCTYDVNFNLHRPSIPVSEWTWVNMRHCQKLDWRSCYCWDYIVMCSDMLEGFIFLLVTKSGGGDWNHLSMFSCVQVLSEQYLLKCSAFCEQIGMMVHYHKLEFHTKMSCKKGGLLSSRSKWGWWLA